MDCKRTVNTVFNNNPQGRDLRSSGTLPIGFPETSVRNYHYTLRNIPKWRRFHLLRGRNPELTHPQGSRLTGRSKTDGGIVYKQNLIDAKLKTGKRAQKQR
jgi:hypothetical protein